MDFDDIIANTVALLQNEPDVLDYYQNRFKYIMVDEYQDTNHAQYVLTSLLADKYKISVLSVMTIRAFIGSGALLLKTF